MLKVEGHWETENKICVNKAGIIVLISDERGILTYWILEYEKVLIRIKRDVVYW